MTNLLEFGNRVKQRRIELSITQEELAKRAGYTSRSSINKIELGLVDLPQSKIVALANALNVSPTYLVGWGNVNNGIIGNQNNNNVISIGGTAGEIESELIRLCQKMSLQEKIEVLNFATNLINKK